MIKWQKLKKLDVIPRNGDWLLVCRFGKIYPDVNKFRFFKGEAPDYPWSQYAEFFEAFDHLPSKIHGGFGIYSYYSHYTTMNLEGLEWEELTDLESVVQKKQNWVAVYDSRQGKPTSNTINFVHYSREFVGENRPDIVKNGYQTLDEYRDSENQGYDNISKRFTHYCFINQPDEDFDSREWFDDNYKENDMITD